VAFFNGIDTSNVFSSDVHQSDSALSIDFDKKDESVLPISKSSSSEEFQLSEFDKSKDTFFLINFCRSATFSS
jgi:hypothetical protein